MYDLANSTFVTSVITVFYPIYFAKTADPSLPPAQVTADYARATTIALAIIAVMSPFLGLLADHYAIRKKMLAVFLVGALCCTAGLALTPPGMSQLGLVLFGLANIGAAGSFVFYDSLLPHVARPEEMDRVSSAGYAMGYLGGGFLLLINVIWVMKPEMFGMGDALTAMRWSIGSVVIWWGAFSLPLFLRVPEPPGSAPSADEPRRGPWSELGGTFREMATYRPALIMMLSFLFFNDGISTIIRNTTVYGTGVGIDTNTMIVAILAVQFLGIPCTYIFAALANRIGTKQAIGVALAVYTAVTYVAYSMTTATEFWILAMLVAFAQGGSQALSRSLFASMIPERKSSQFFAFFAVAEKFAGVFGSFVFWMLTVMTGDGRLAVLSLVGFFIVGGALLAMVDVEKGRAQAQAANAPERERREAAES